MKYYIIILAVCVIWAGCKGHTPLVGARGNTGEMMSQAREQDAKQSDLTDLLAKSRLAKVEAERGPEEASDAPVEPGAPPSCAPLAAIFEPLLGGTLTLTETVKAQFLRGVEKYLSAVDDLPDEVYLLLEPLERVALLINLFNFTCVTHVLSAQGTLTLTADMPPACANLSFAFYDPPLPFAQMPDKIRELLQIEQTRDVDLLFWNRALYQTAVNSTNLCRDLSSLIPYLQALVPPLL